MKAKGTIGLLILIIIGISAFTWMISRPATEVIAIQFGVPPDNINTKAPTNESQEKAEPENELPSPASIELKEVDPVAEGE